MKNIVSAVLLIVFSSLLAFPQQNGAVASQGTAQKAPASKAKVLTREEFDNLVADPSHVLLIDVRRPDEVTSNGGFPVYLSIQINNLEKSLAWIPKDRAIITVSNHAARGGQAADLLAKHGFNVAGTIGAQVYEEQGGKLTKIVPPPSNPPAQQGTEKKQE